MSSRTSRVATLLFGSGFCALVYQTAWLREFRLIFGASTLASAAVLAIFIGGLGAGSLILGPRADRHPRPLLFYAALEAIVAVSAALTPLLILLARAIYLASGGAGTLGTIAATVERLILSVLVLAVPTIAMGGTLPAAARAVTSLGDVRRQSLSTLYALNTIGAVAGCLAATFFLLEVYGTRATIWLAAAVNILVAVSARVLDRANQQNLSNPSNLPELSNLSNQEHPESPENQSTVFVTVAAAAVGFAFFLMELVWYRLLAPLLGGSVFTFGLVLAVALAGIGLGGLLYSLASSDRPASLSGFAASCLLEALAVDYFRLDHRHRHRRPAACGDRRLSVSTADRSLRPRPRAHRPRCRRRVRGEHARRHRRIAGWWLRPAAMAFGNGCMAARGRDARVTRRRCRVARQSTHRTRRPHRASVRVLCAVSARFAFTVVPDGSNRAAARGRDRTDGRVAARRYRRGSRGARCLRICVAPARVGERHASRDRLAG
jgi:MFS family permease